MSDNVKRVVVVRKATVKAIPPQAIKPTKAEKKAYTKAQLEDGKKFFNFWWDESKFAEFADKCTSHRIKPNAYLWSLIKKDMGWTE